MLELDAANTLCYLESRGDIPHLAGARVELLGWGVSNVVLRVYRQGAPDLVLKQSRTQLRTKAPWFSRLERIYREVGLLRVLHPLLPPGEIPAVLFEDRPNYAFGMEAVPADHVVWKADLLAGRIDQSLAPRLGASLGMVHATTFHDVTLEQAWADLTVFDELRVDPFYRYLAQQRPEVAAELAQLVELSLSVKETLVLADFSPKNILLSGERITLVDFETGHFGDPAFDLGFFLSHILLKGIHHAPRFAEFALLTQNFWLAYWAAWGATGSLNNDSLRQALTARTQKHLAGCLWARIDGKSTVDYLPDPAQHECVRRIGRRLLTGPALEWAATLDVFVQEISRE